VQHRQAIVSFAAQTIFAVVVYDNEIEQKLINPTEVKALRPVCSKNYCPNAHTHTQRTSLIALRGHSSDRYGLILFTRQLLVTVSRAYGLGLFKAPTP